jgi:lactoylglutathione lyase
MIEALNELEVITFYVESAQTAKTFYQDVFGLQVIYEDEVSAVLQLKNLMINLLQESEAPKLIEPAAVADRQAGSRLLLTIQVADAEAVCAQLREHGVTLLNGPVDRPWGRRTAAFADPDGNVWEIAQNIPQA